LFAKPLHNKALKTSEFSVIPYEESQSTLRFLFLFLSGSMVAAWQEFLGQFIFQ
jgi:hypothetical protein